MLLTSVEQLKDAIAQFLPLKQVSLDLETTGLTPAEGDRMCMAGMYHPDVGTYSVCFRQHGFAPNLPVESIKLFQPMLDKCELIGHNIGPFDLNVLRVENLNIKKSRVWDTLLATILWDDSLSGYSMEALAPMVGKTKDIRTRKLKNKGMDFAPVDMVVERVESDVEIAWELMDFLKPKILERGDPYPELLKKEMRWAKFLGELEWTGIYLDEANTEELLQITRRIAFEIEQSFWERWRPGFKLGSPQQVLKYLKGTYNLDVPDTEDWVLKMAAIERKDPQLQEDVDAILSYRRYTKMQTSWLGPWLRSFRRGGERVRGHWGLDASNEAARASGLTRTLRLRCSKPNLTAVPVDDPLGNYRLRSLFTAEGDNELVGYDWSQAEIRIGAHYAREERLLEELRDPKGDAHQRVADDIKLDRYRAKRINLGWQYGIGQAHLAEELTKELLEIVKEEDTRKWLQRYRNRYPNLVRISAQCERVIQQRGYLTLWSGRRVHFNPERDEPRKAFNLLVQTGVSEILKEGVLRHQDFVAKHGLKQKIVLCIHDEIITECPPEELEYMDDLKREFESIGPEGGWRCPLFVETWHRKRWSNNLAKELS